MKTVQLTINGKRVEATPGTSLLVAAREAGIDIPTLCHNDAVEPYGACRMCLVDIEKGGRKKTVASCVYTVEPGLNVTTSTPKLERMRKLIVELLSPAYTPASREHCPIAHSAVSVFVIAATSSGAMPCTSPAEASTAGSRSFRGQRRSVTIAAPASICARAAGWYPGTRRTRLRSGMSGPDSGAPAKTGQRAASRTSTLRSSFHDDSSVPFESSSPLEVVSMRVVLTPSAPSASCTEPARRPPSARL